MPGLGELIVLLLIVGIVVGAVVVALLLQKRRSVNAPGKSALGAVVGGIVALVAVALFLLDVLPGLLSSGPPPPLALPRTDESTSTPQMSAAAQPARPADVANEEWVLDTDGEHDVTFTLNAPTTVSIDVSPVRDADKGVSFQLVQADSVRACLGETNGTCFHVPAFSRQAVRSFNHSDVVSAGRWTFYVKNTENLINTAIVHVHVVVGG